MFKDIKDILVKPDGSINEEEIAHYIAAHENNVDAPYDNPNSKFNDQTLFYAAMTHDEISSYTKVRLASYLITKGAKVNKIGSTMEKTPNKYDELIDIALQEKNYEATYLLLREAKNVYGSFYNAYSGKSLLDVALDKKNEEILSWILKNAPTLLSKIRTDKFNKYYESIIKTFPNFENSENYLLLKQIAEERIDYLFTQLGLIESEDMALILAAKMSKKPYPNSIFVIKKGDNLGIIADQIKKILESETSEDIIKFQVIYYQGHGCFGEFEIDKTNNPPTVRYAHIDPFPQLIKYNVLITNDFVRKISPLANIEILESDLMMQKGASCTFFSVDGAMTLSTPSERDYVSSVMEHMNKHGKELPHPFKEENVKYKRSPTLPTRLTRGLHYIDDDLPFRGLNSLIFNSPEKATIVNKKGETAEKAIRNDIQQHPSTSNSNITRDWNMRIERKMKQLGQAVHDFIIEQNINVLDPSFSRLFDQYNLNGLVQFCEEKIEPNEKTLLC
ncbi:hypothetical protein [Legionella cardiaca]|uniref:Ankyrin repeat protein n=1 Tax=Legionella cardiaca TaxID=1071983 RepID=A0ABY8AS29_9GAMM|nr:hypothetical protein [Legionella cardiaca]WED42096.1 hypothetical protein PXX05_09130 [Legionella cardiaca]